MGLVPSSWDLLSTLLPNWINLVSNITELGLLVPYSAIDYLNGMDSDNILNGKRERLATEKGISYQISVTTKCLQNSCRLWEQTLDNCRQVISSGRIDNNAIEVNLARLSQLKREAEEYQTSLYALGFTDMQNLTNTFKS